MSRATGRGRRWAWFDAGAPKFRKRVLVSLGGGEHALLPTEALWLARELIEAAEDGLTNAEGVR